MPLLPILRAHDIIAALHKAGFETIRHVRLKHADGRVVTVPAHPGQDIGRGLLCKILRDAELSRDDFLGLI